MYMYYMYQVYCENKCKVFTYTDRHIMQEQDVWRAQYAIRRIIFRINDWNIGDKLLNTCMQLYMYTYTLRVKSVIIIIIEELLQAQLWLYCYHAVIIYAVKARADNAMSSVGQTLLLPSLSLSSSRCT